MDAGTWGLIGGMVGTAGGMIGAYLGCARSYRAAVNEAQRRFYRYIFALLIPLALLFLAVVWGAALQVLPQWSYYLAMIAWFAPLGPAIVWSNRHLAELAAVPDADAIEQQDPN